MSNRYLIRRALTTAAVLALVTTPLAVSAAIATVAAKPNACDTANGLKVTNVTICKGLAFYKGKTVTFIAPTTAGSSYDIVSRAFAKEMSAYLGADINVEDIGAANGITGMDGLAGASPNGLTVGYYGLANILGFVLTGSPGVDFNVKNVALFGSETNSVQLLATLTNSPYTSFETLKANDSESTPTTLVTTIGLSGLITMLTMREFNLPVRYLTGYSGTTAATTGFLRGDGVLDGAGPGTLHSYIVAGAVRVLAIETQALKLNRGAPLYSSLNKIPTNGALDKKYPLKTNGEKAAARDIAVMNLAPNFALGGPPGMPSYLLMTVRTAVKWSALSTYVKTQIAGVGNPIGFIDPSTAKSGFLRSISSASEIRSFLGFG